MLQKMTSQHLVAVLGLALALIFGSGITSDAQVIRSEYAVEGLFAASNTTPEVNETVEFEMDLRTVLFFNLHQRSIVQVEWDFGDGNSSQRTTLANQLYAYAEPGEYEATLRVYTPYLIFTATQDVNVQSEEPDDFRPNVAQIQLGLVTITTFDVNGDNRLDDGEFFAAIDAWVEGRLNTELFFLAVDIWVENSTIIATRTIESSGSLSVNAQSTPAGYTFSAEGVDAQQISVTILDAHGAMIFERQQAGRTLSWSGLDSSGTPVANGTYFYMIKTMGADGEIHMSTPQPIAVMR